ncbi:hypothetical protein FNAPI_5342 [Fusarium napiforme]|uniref:Uncharacterized protein n=1 Tax=Fusarium napiforme TaxID=42672 RepID=A0A8H5JM27_9HYPO|nr:hypothetical protein FNAPI_5342 [Fusarium napiforme]
MPDILLTNLHGTSNAGRGPLQGGASTTPGGNNPPTSQEELDEKVLRTISTLRTALPSNQESTCLDDDSGQKPRFGDLSLYNVTDQDEKYLWEIEVTRIVSSLSKAQEPIGSDHSPELSANINNLGFTWLENLSDQLLCALSICGLDDNLLARPEAGIGMPSRGSVIGRSFDRLQTRLGKAQKLVRKGGRRGVESSREYEDPDDETVVLDGVSAVTDSEAPAYYHLVDYITETVARLLCGSYTRDEVDWVSIVITMLAKYSTKLKVLSGELPTYGAKALKRHSGARKLLKHDPFIAAENPSELRLDLEVSRQSQDSDAALARGPEDLYITTYVSDMMSMSNWLFRLLWHVLKDLNTRNTRNREADEFEVSSVVFPTGSQGTSANAFQNRLGHISGSSSGVAVGITRRATNLLSDTAKIIDNRIREGPGLMTGVSKLFIEAGNLSGEQAVDLKLMGELISVMVISSCMDPCVTDDMVSLCASLRVSHILSKIYKDSKEYTAFVCLYNSLSQKHPPKLQRSRPLSDYVEANGIDRVTPQTSEAEESPRQYDLDAIKAVEKEISASTRQSISDSAAKWAIEEHAISVSCLPYTLSIMSGCTALVLGGLMAGFFVGSRIDGVDPFNLTMFAWIIAGFIILVSKSIRVGEWTWRDFLKGRVTCRTVHELANVTNLSEQNIIMHLLSTEKESPIVFRGPYNNVFSDTGAEGFSIDVKPTVSTLFAAGLIVLEVLLESGSALVCLDIRPHVTAINSGDKDSGYELDIIAHGLSKQRMVHRQRKPCRVLACKDPPLQDETEKDILFRQQPLHWEKIIGVYNRLDQSVR